VSTLVTGPAPAAEDYGHHACVLNWDHQFIPWLKGKITHADAGGVRVPLPPPWPPGAHWALIGPTGEGKSTFAAGILSTRKWVLALDPKGEDETLSTTGYERVFRMPLPKDRLAPFRDGEPRPGTDDWLWHRVERGLPVGLVAGFESQTDAEDAALARLMADCITFTRRSRGWTLYVDEFELLSSARMMGLAAPIERMLITARRAGTSVVTAYQAPAWVSKHATRQASYLSLWPTRDRDMVQAAARSMGRDWRTVAAAVDELPPFHVLVIPKQRRAPFIVTSAPKRG
jgi:hypothetical protein